MPAWLAPLAISTGINFLGKAFGKQGYERGLTGEGSDWLKNLLGRWDEGIPSSLSSKVSAPFIRAGKGIKQRYARQPASSGLQGAQETRLAAAEGSALAEATSSWKMNLARMIS
ncbi:unnamed protein product, partial [marine sediment metagenome]